jgi:hypothetical protein
VAKISNAPSNPMSQKVDQKIVMNRVLIEKAK